MAEAPHDQPQRNWFGTKISGWFWSLTPTCKEVARLTSEERERPLPLGTRLRLGLHRSFCQWCARYAKQLDFLHEANAHFSEHADEAGGPSLDSDARARMKRALQDQRRDGSYSAGQ